MRTPYPHNLSVRKSAESIVVQLQDELGHTGFGEGSPRSYVTGETPESCLDFLNDIVFPWLSTQTWPDSLTSRAEFMDFLARFHSEFPVIRDQPSHSHNSSRAAVEIALADCALQRAGARFEDFFPIKRNLLRYSPGIGSVNPPVAFGIASASRILGFKDLKVKLNGIKDIERTRAVRRATGRKTCLRLDANQAYCLNNESHIRKLHSFKEFQPVCIEEPFAEKDHEAIRKVREHTGLTLMADESLLSLDDAQTIIALKSYNALNLRISKMGGIYPLIQIKEMASRHGLLLLLGCHVGELAILSRVGQLLAAHYSDIVHLEGGFGTWILKSDVDSHSRRMGYGGKFKVLPGDVSFGLHVAPSRLQHWQTTSLRESRSDEEVRI